MRLQSGCALGQSFGVHFDTESTHWKRLSVCCCNSSCLYCWIRFEIRSDFSRENLREYDVWLEINYYYWIGNNEYALFIQCTQESIAAAFYFCVCMWFRNTKNSHRYHGNIWSSIISLSLSLFTFLFASLACPMIRFMCVHNKQQNYCVVRCWSGTAFERAVVNDRTWTTFFSPFKIDY